MKGRIDLLAPSSNPAELAALRHRVASLLIGETCGRIGFRMSGRLSSVQVRPGGYAMIGMAVAVAPSVQQGFIRHRQMGVVVETQATGVAASYSPRFNRLSFPNPNFGMAPSERANIVHEATHALYDYLRFRVTRLEAEAGAFIAEALFKRLEGLDGSQATNPVRRVAWEISADLLGTASQAAMVNPEQQRRLMHEVSQRPVYRRHGAQLHERARFDGGRI